MDPLILTGYLLLSVVIVVPVAASTFAGVESLSGGAALRRLAVVASYAWGLGVVVLASGLITVNLEIHYRRILLPGTRFLIAGLTCGAAATVFAGLISAMVTRRYSAAAARNMVRLVFLALVVFIAALVRFGGPEWPLTVYRWSTAAHLSTLCMVAAAVLAAADGLLAITVIRGSEARPATE